MSVKSNKFLDQIKKATENNEASTRLAKVTEITGGSIYLTFYGETEQSIKPYKTISGYSANVNDTVILQKVGNSFVILGKVV